MKKPLLNAKELEASKEFLTDFPAFSSSSLPKLMESSVDIDFLDSSHRVVEDGRRIDEGVLMAELVDFEQLNSDPTRPIYYYDFRVQKSFGSGESLDAFDYEPGDSFGFYPKSSQDQVDHLSRRLSLDPSAFVKLSSTTTSPQIKAFFPQLFVVGESIVVTVAEVLERLDVHGLPKKAVLRTLAEYCQDPLESAQLLFLSSRAGSDAYNRLRCEEKLSALLLLAAFDSLRPPLNVLVGILGPLQPRYYSCCRKREKQKEIGSEFGSDNSQFFNFQIVFNVVGVCSSWLQSLRKTGCSLPIIKRSISAFRLHLTPSRPIIMIAAGTGVAPFIGFLESIRDNNTVDSNNDNSSQINRPFTWLIFGFRSRQDDFIFEKDLLEFQSTGILKKLSLAVSRDPIEPKTHVQDVVRRCSREFYDLLVKDEAIVYICGDELTMIKGVNDAMIDLLIDNGMVNGGSGEKLTTKKEAEAVLMQWSREEKIIRDIWV